MKYERLKENLNVMCMHNHTQGARGRVVVLTNGRKTENQVIDEVVSDCREILNKIEQGTLIELPCKVGDIVWVVCGDISQYKVTEFWYDGVFFNFRGENNEYVEEHKRFRFFDERIGETVFLTREEAENA